MNLKIDNNYSSSSYVIISWFYYFLSYIFFAIQFLSNHWKFHHQRTFQSNCTIYTNKRIESLNTQKNCQKKKNTFNSLSLSFRKKNLSKLSPRFHAWSRVSCRSIDLLLSFEHADISERFTADRDEQISGEGWILINRKLIVPKVGLSLSTERLPSARERGMSAAGLLSARPRPKRTAKRQQPCRVRWVENMGGKNSNPGGCIVAVAVITTGKRTPSTLFLSFLPLPLLFLYQVHRVVPPWSRCPQGPASCYHPGLASLL